MTSKYIVEGMTCAGCAAGVEQSVAKLDGVTSALVNLVEKTLVVESKKDISAAVVQQINAMGFRAKHIEREENAKIEISNNLKNKHLKLKKNLIISLVLLIPLMYVAMHHMIGLPLFSFLVGAENAITIALFQLALTLPIMWVNRNYFISGFVKLFKRKPNMDSLVAIGTTASFLFSTISLIQIIIHHSSGNTALLEAFLHNLYFEGTATILTLITLGKFLESASKNKTRFAIEKLIALSPDTVTIFVNNTLKEISTKDVSVGDIIFVRPGEQIGIDGVVVDGSSYVDESAITGESMPVFKEPGSAIVSASINKSGAFYFRAEKVGSDTTIAKIISLVEVASSSKAPISKLADRISGIFVPIVLAISFITALVWIMIGDYSMAFSSAVSVLVISCPCALGLATPLAIMVGTGLGAEHGILIKSAEALEIAHTVDTVIFDKTGTITEGNPAVTDIVSYSISESELLQIASSLEHASTHPIARAIVTHAKEKSLSQKKVKNFLSVDGKGVEGEIGNKKYFIGNDKYLNEHSLEIVCYDAAFDALQQAGKTVVIVFDEKNIVGLIAVSDKIKSTSAQAIAQFKKLRLDTWLITGDNIKSANYVKEQVGIANVVASCSPEDKEKYVRQLQLAGKVVAFVGDGINDAPALTKADVGIAIGSGTDIAIESADIVLVKNDLLDAVTAIALSKKTITNIKQNLFWAFFYNVTFIPIAAGAFFHLLGLKLNPMIAALAMSASSLFVVLNSLRLKFFKGNLKN